MLTLPKHSDKHSNININISTNIVMTINIRINIIYGKKLQELPDASVCHLPFKVRPSQNPRQ